jgi:molybdenum cofactor guanylyltransferase
MDLDGFILIGGASSRMGSDKSRLRFGELTAVERIANALSSMATRVFTVGKPEMESLTTALPHVADLYQQWGALGGIHAALNAAESEWIAVVACDLPFVTKELFARLWSVTSESEATDAIVPIQADGWPQPLCAFYRRESCLKKIEELIAVGEHMPRALLATVTTRWVRPDEVGDLPGAANFFFNTNTPGDYERAKQILAGAERY